MTVRRTWEIRIMNRDECVASVRVPEYTGIDVSPIYEGCSKNEPILKWSGEIAMGKPSYCTDPFDPNEWRDPRWRIHELVWHRASDVLPIIDGRYLICTGVAMWPVIAHICVCRPAVIWSRLIKGTHERVDTDEVYWWAEIPLPVEE